MNAREYMENKYNTLKNDYRTPDGLYSEHCGLIALEIAGLLIQEGLSPEVYCIRGNPVLVPLAYNNRVVWGAHQICIANKIVYDPIMNRPISIQKYGMAVFGSKVNFELMFATDKIIEILHDFGNMK